MVESHIEWVWRQCGRIVLVQLDQSLAQVCGIGMLAGKCIRLKLVFARARSTHWGGDEGQQRHNLHEQQQSQCIVF